MEPLRISQYSLLANYFLQLSQFEKSQEKYRRDLARNGVTPYMCLKSIVRSEGKNLLITNEFISDFMKLDPNETLPFIKLTKFTEKRLDSRPDGFLASLYPDKNIDFYIQLEDAKYIDIADLSHFLLPKTDL